MTEGSRPLVYEAVNSHGKPDLRHNAQGHRPEHLVFFLSHISMTQAHKVEVSCFVVFCIHN
jgi:hypothetical protein